MLNIALIRHGSTVGNLYGAYIGTTDQPLCAEGRDELLEKMRVMRYPKTSLLFSSPMSRCVQTAKLLYPNMDPVIVDDLRECSFGHFEGMNHAEITNMLDYNDWGMDVDNMVFPGGEEWDDFSFRCQRGFHRMVKTMINSKINNAVAVVHGGTIMAIITRFHKDTNRYDWQSGPGEGYLLSFDPKFQTGTVEGRICP